MKREELEGSYGLVVSLGSFCQVAYQMKKHKLRRCSLPFDWMVLESVPCLIMIMKNKFDGYFSKENLTVKGKHDHTYLVYDEKYQCMSVHDFPHVENDNTERIFDIYPQFIEKIQRRIDRFYVEIGNANANDTDVLFIRYQASYDEAVSLSACLKTLTNNHYKLIVLNETKEKTFFEETWDIENTYAARIYQSENIPWSGYDAHWDLVLNGITLQNPVEEYVLKNPDEEFDPKKQKDLAFKNRGIYDNEGTFHWLSPKATIALKSCRIMKHGLQIHFSTPCAFLPFSDNDEPPFTEIYINGISIKKIHWDISQSYVETFPAAQLPPPNETGAYEIDFITNGRYNPKEMGKSDDDRDLAVSLYYIGAIK